ncbi:MAG: M23 family metallopeptidase [Cellvibrionales bacterium]|nr:M23 family metallopeptidase [Cellvibrionales bacterium]
MKLIIIGNGLEPSRQVEIKPQWFWAAGSLVAFVVLALLLSLGLAYDRGSKLTRVTQELSRIEADVLYDKSRLNSYLSYSEALTNEQSKQAGLLQAKITRLEILGQRMLEGAGIESEFDFTHLPAMGGEFVKPHEVNGLTTVELNQLFHRLEQTLSIRERELNVLSSLLQDTRFSKERYLAGKPIEKGWLSSHYGLRKDPFHGREAFHKGLDFAGKAGSNILSVASGVVTWSGDRYGFGTMVEIDHANGYVTRYAHNESNVVEVGDVVSKGQVIAKMGSTGRSTGAHVHFEVLKHGKSVDPKRYIYRKAI